MLLDWSDFPILYFYSHFFNKSNSITAFSKTFHCLSLPVNSTQLNSTQLSSIMLGSLFAIWNYTMALLSTKWHQKISYHGQVSSHLLTSPHIDRYLSYSHEILSSLYRCLIQLTLTITVTPYHLITLILILILILVHILKQTLTLIPNLFVSFISKSSLDITLHTTPTLISILTFAIRKLLLYPPSR